MKQDGNEPRFDRFRVGPPPDGLRARVLEAARTALLEERPPGVWDRLYESRPLRLGWAVAAALLILAHVVITPGLGRKARPVLAAADVDVDGAELREATWLPRVEPSGAESLEGTSETENDHGNAG